MGLFVELFALAATIPVSTSVERALDTSFRAMPSAKNIVTSRRDIRAIQAVRNPNHAKARGDERYRTELVSDLIQYVSNALESAALLGSLSGARERKTTRAGRAGDKVALNAARAAETPAAAAIRSLGATNLGLTATRAASIAAKFALPVMAAKALFDAGRGYQKDGLKGAILGAGDSVAFGRASAALTGWQQGGAAGV
jgi:hypothetical protein